MLSVHGMKSNKYIDCFLFMSKYIFISYTQSFIHLVFLCWFFSFPFLISELKKKKEFLFARGRRDDSDTIAP